VAVPKRKTSPSRKGMRQARQATAVAGAYTVDSASGSLRLRHHASRMDDGAIMFRGKVLKAAKVKATAVNEEPVAE
jgi:ribosomal protein L32